jgi:hypothetical protein
VAYGGEPPQSGVVFKHVLGGNGKGEFHGTAPVTGAGHTNWLSYAGGPKISKNQSITQTVHVVCECGAFAYRILIFAFAHHEADTVA